MKKHIFILVSVIAIVAIISFVAFKSFDSKINSKEEPQATQLPPIISKIKTLEVVNARIINPGTRDALVLIDVKNNSPRPIVSVNVESGDKKDTSGTMISGFGIDPPKIIIEPFGMYTLDFPITSIIRGLPIRISGVIYANGSEDGEPRSRENMRKTNENERIKHNKKGEGE